jgi:MarR family transcriptional regulator, organic hydroperoxide resistance regulator
MSPAEELRYLILALQREGNRQFLEMLHPLGLTPAQSEVLKVLEQFGELTLIELGERLVCETGSPSRLVKTMVEAGYLQKKENPDDGRAVLLSLTPKAHALMPGLNSLETSYNESVAELVAHLPIPVETLLEILWHLVGDTAAGTAISLRKEGL